MTKKAVIELAAIARAESFSKDEVRALSTFCSQFSKWSICPVTVQVERTRRR